MLHGVFSQNSSRGSLLITHDLELAEACGRTGSLQGSDLETRTRSVVLADDVARRFGAWITIHGAVMVIAGLSFGVGVIRAGGLPRWTGACLMAGAVLVAIGSGLSDVAQTASAGVRDLAFIGMGVSLWRAPHGAHARAQVG